jgi:hypothetical protein
LDPIELGAVHMDGYILGASYCRRFLHKGGSCIYVQDTLRFVSVDLHKFSSDQDTEACAILLITSLYEIFILSVYRAPSSNFSYFLNKLEAILNFIYQKNTSLILCGDFNVNYLTDNNKKNHLDTLLATFNLTGTVTLPTRSQNNSVTAIDNIFIDITKHENYNILPIFNGLSDHDAQLIIINDIKVDIRNVRSKQIRKIDYFTLLDFQYKLSFESWDSIFDTVDVNMMFNSFLSTFLRIFYSSFPLKNLKTKTHNSGWITLGIRISCKHKRELTY